MRKSMQDFDPRLVRKVDDYPGLPEELKEFCYWIADSGYCIMAIPEAVDDVPDHPWLSELPIPVKYVLEKGYFMMDGYVIVDAPYDKDWGLMIDDKYTEY